jgi:hypothetical protein
MMHVQQNKFIVKEAGRYRLWAAATEGHAISIVVNGIATGIDSYSYLGPWSDPKVEGDWELGENDVVTVRPANAHLTVSRHPDFEPVYDSHQPTTPQ